MIWGKFAAISDARGQTFSSSANLSGNGIPSDWPQSGIPSLCGQTVYERPGIEDYLGNVRMTQQTLKEVLEYGP